MPSPEEYAAAAKKFREENWQNGGTTVTDTTESQNLANVYKGGVDPNKPVIPSQYIQGVLSQAEKDTAGQSMGGSGVSGGDTGSSGGSGGGSQPSDNGLGNAQNYINQLNDLRKNSALSALQKSHDAALSGMGAEKSAIQPKYYDARNATAAGGQQQARNFAEYMAQRGGSAGTAGQATLANNLNTQSSLSNLGRQEAAAYTDIERRTSDLNNAYQSDIATTTANAEADKMQLLYAEYVRAQERGDTKAQQEIQNKMAEAQLTGQYNGGQTIAAKQADASTKLAEAGLTGVLNGKQTLQSKQLDRSNFESDRSYNLAKSAQDWNQAFQTEQYSDQKAQQIWENTFKDKSFTQSMNDAAASRGLQWANLNQNQKEFIANQEFREKSFTADQEQRTIDNAANKDKLDWDKDPLNPSNIKEVKEPKPIAVDQKVSTDNYNSAISQLKAKKGITNADAMVYLKAVSSNVTDSDYKALSEWINKNIVK